jgi:hypothetical protein
MDKYYHIQYIRSKYILVLLIIFWAVFFAVSIIFIFSVDFIQILFSKNTILISMLIFLYLFASMFLMFNFGMKIFTKEINMIIKDERFDINEGEKIIFFKDINTLKLETIKHLKYKIITGYILIIEWNNEKMKIIVYTGTSEKEKRNCDALLNFYEELHKKYKVNLF